MPSLTLEKVNKFYRLKRNESVHAVKDFSLAASEGQIVALLGSSGCGKTSILRMVAGFETVSSGSIRLGERQLNSLRPADRNVAMAFEGYALYPPLSVFENLAFALKRSELSRQEISHRVHEIAELLEITDILERRPLGLSGGQQQRVSLARALLRTPGLYLLDEPMSQLEPQLRAVLRTRIKEYLLRRSVTTVFVTHDQTEALALADRVAVMEEGVLQQYGTPFELENRPVNLFVGAFIGEPPMNILDMEVTRVDDGVVHFAVADQGSLEPLPFDLPAAWLTDAMRGALRPGRKLYLGIRAHQVRFVESHDSGTPQDPSQVIDVQVQSNQWLGDQSHLALSAGGRTLIAVSAAIVPFAAGTRTKVQLPKEHLHIFDAVSTNALFHGQIAHEEP